MVVDCESTVVTVIVEFRSDINEWPLDSYGSTHHGMSPSVPLLRRQLSISTNMEVEYEHGDAMELEDGNIDDMPVTQEDAWAVIRYDGGAA